MHIIMTVAVTINRVPEYAIWHTVS